MENNEFPKFVPDQLLTSDNLNQLFNYLDEQEHLTRTCLIGVGIVCGLQVETNAAGTSIKITKGCGITTEGFLVEVPTTEYAEFVPFDPVKERYYEPFVNIGTKQKKFDLFELVQPGVIEESVPLNDAFISDKVVLIFVELLEQRSKNCDPNSCDDKGIQVTVTFRPLLVSKTNAAALIAGTGGPVKILPPEILELPELRMRRVDVPFTGLLDSTAVFEAFLDPLSKTFIDTVEDRLTNAYTALHDLIADIHQANPFTGLAARFQFLIDRNMSQAQLLHLQYYYDLFSDILAAYEELRSAACGISGVCCPEDNFPRHLLLGDAKGYNAHVHSAYRHYFIPSPILARKPCVLDDLRSLLLRLALLINRFEVPQPTRAAGVLVPEFIRITPSAYGNVPLSSKAIPYYYSVTQTPNPLYVFWDSRKTRRSAADQNLSYHAVEYNNSDDSVRFPLLYDLESFNFLRVEGHIGQNIVRSLASIEAQRTKYRLPIDVIALSSETASLLQRLTSTRDLSRLNRADCHFRELEALYAALEKALICFLCKEMKYFYGLSRTSQTPGTATLVPKASLLTKCDPGFRYAAGSVGAEFEQWYATMKKPAYIRAEATLATSAYATYKEVFNAAINVETGSPALIVNTDAAPRTVATNPVLIQAYVAVVNQFLLFILYYIQRLSELLKGSIADLDITEFAERFTDLQDVATAYKEVLSRNIEGAVSFKIEDLLDHLDRLTYACNLSEFRSLAAEFEKRWRLLEALRRLAYYERKCPGFQHKAGVTIGGTFILVYHERSPVEEGTLRRFVAAEKKFDSEESVIDDLRARIDRRRRKKSGLDDLVEELPDGTVIADFFLPFICCSDCPPIQYQIVLRDKQEGAGVTISVTPAAFCQEQTDPVPILVSPPGGEVTGDGVKADGDKGFVFVPAEIAVGRSVSKEVKLTYTVEGAAASVKVRVYHEPTAEIEFARKPAVGSGRIEVDGAPSTFVEQYKWDFGDGTPPVLTQRATHEYQKSGDYNLVLTVTNGPCSAEKTELIRIRLEAPTISVQPAEFCGGNAGPIPIAVTPAGGKVTGDGVKEADGGAFVFIPSEVKLGRTNSKNVQITYEIDGVKVSTTVKVFHDPIAEFEITARPTAESPRIEVDGSDSTFAAHFSWTFGDGSPAVTTPKASHDYKEDGEYEVKLTVRNGPCSSEKSEKVRVQRETPTERVCIPRLTIAERFKNLPQRDPEFFSIFTQEFTQFGAVQELFNALTASPDLSTEAELKIYLEHKVATVLPQWLQLLQRLILNDKPTRNLAVVLYGILSDLAMRIACFQDQDFNAARARMDAAFKLITAHVSQWREVFPQFNDFAKAAVKQLRESVEREFKRLSESGENKPAYKAALEQLREVFGTLPF